MTATIDVPKLTDQLEAIMRDLLIAYEQLHSFAKHRRDAIRAADAARLAACVRQENTIVQQVAEVEKRRIVVVRDLAAALGSTDREQTTVTWIANKLNALGGGGGGVDGANLRILADRLRETITKVSQLNAVTKDAAETLARHMAGIMKAAAQARSYARTYSRAGELADSPGSSGGLNAVA